MQENKEPKERTEEELLAQVKENQAKDAAFISELIENHNYIWREIEGARYLVPEDCREDWKPGEPFAK